MQINLRNDSVEIDGYVNAVERNSKPLMSRIGRFIERVCKGAFRKAIDRNANIRCLLNHEWNRDLGGTADGNLELTEDNIGLRAKLRTDDPEVVQDAREGNLVGWSFGFTDVPDGVEKSIDEETHLPLRKIRDLNLYEVSILNKKKTPAYDGTLIMARSDDEIQYQSEPLMDDVTVNDLQEREQEEPQQTEQSEANKKEIDYSKWDEMIQEMKGDKT